MLNTAENKSETEATNILRKARYAILEGGYDDLALATRELGIVIKEQDQSSKDSPLSPLVKLLITFADILAADRKFLHTAIAAYRDAAHYSAGKDDELNKQAATRILDNAEFLTSSADRIAAYQHARTEVPANSPLAALAIRKSKEQKDSAYINLRSPFELPRLEEAVIEGDLKAVLGVDGIYCVVRQQAQSGDIQYSVVVSRAFSRGDLTRAGVQNAEKLRRTGADDDLDRIIVPSNKLPQQTQRDVDFLLRLRNAGIYVDATHGRTRNAAGEITGYKFSEAANPDRLRYMGIDTQDIAPNDGKILVPIENIQFYADPGLIGKWNWMPTGNGNIRARVPNNERFTTINCLQTYGITPSGNNVSTEYNGYIVVAGEFKERMNSIIRQHALQERSVNLLHFAEALPGFASSIAVAAYKDACGTLFGPRRRK